MDQDALDVLFELCVDTNGLVCLVLIIEWLKLGPLLGIGVYEFGLLCYV